MYRVLRGDFLASLLTVGRRGSVVAGMAFKHFLASLLTSQQPGVQCAASRRV